MLAQLSSSSSNQDRVTPFCGSQFRMRKSSLMDCWPKIKNLETPALEGSNRREKSELVNPRVSGPGGTKSVPISPITKGRLTCPRVSCKTHSHSAFLRAGPGFRELLCLSGRRKLKLGGQERGVWLRKRSTTPGELSSATNASHESAVGPAATELLTASALY